MGSEGSKPLREDIRTEEVPSCLLCGEAGSLLYKGLHDRLFGSPGEWSYSRCPRCGLVWINPRPSRKDLAKIYATYYTHDGQDHSRLARLREKVLLAVCSTFPGCENLSPGPTWKLAGKVFRRVPTFGEMARLTMRGLETERRGTVLDVGCGSGEFLSLAQRVGWQVLGVEVDPAAAELARSRYGIPVRVGTLQEAALPTSHFDAVNLGHVIEHLYDPVGLLSECRRVLKANGRLFLSTPNIDGLGHQKFGQFWRGLEPPRHFHLFSSNTLRSCVEKSGLKVKTIRTSAQTGAYVWRCSITRGDSRPMTLRLRLGGWAFRAREEHALKANAGIGEEIVLIAQKEDAY